MEPDRSVDVLNAETDFFREAPGHEVVSCLSVHVAGGSYDPAVGTKLREREPGEHIRTGRGSVPGEGATDSRHVGIAPQGRDGHARRVLARRRGVGVLLVDVVIPLDGNDPRHMARVLYSAQIIEQPAREQVESP